MPGKEKKIVKATIVPVADSEIPTCRERVIIVGRKHTSQTFNLPHEVYCEQLGECHCHEVDVATSYHGDDGMKRVKTEKKLVCQSITVRYGERISVFRAALTCPEVRSALDPSRRWLRLER